MNKNILSKFTISAIILLIIISTVTLYNLRNTTLKAAVINAENFSEVVKDGLTSYMVNCDFDKSQIFLSNILDNKNISNIRVIRNQNLHDQYGLRSDKLAKTDIEKEVLKTGETKYVVKEDLLNSQLKITVPLKYEPTKNIDCKSCHNIQKDDVLGALSIDMNISELKLLGFGAFYVIPVIILLALLYFWFLFRNSSNDYDESFKLLQENVKSSIQGKLEPIQTLKPLPSDVNNYISEYNQLISNIKSTTEDIDSKLRGFIGHSSISSRTNNALEDTKVVIDNLSNLYHFKKQIEQDKTREEIFDRLAQVFQNKFGLKNFTIFEIFKKSEKINVLQSVGNSFYCMKYLMDNPVDCRCSRTSKDVHSIDFHKSCPFFDEEDKFFYCLNIKISDDRDIIFNFCVDSQKELDNLKNDILFIKAFINEAVPSIEVKILMQALKDSAFTDNLTGLYNRTFLEEHSKKLIPQVNRDKKSIGVLLLDMDHFKAVNDEYGHDIGDKVLKELSRILSESIRESDIAIRYGGEEFIVLLIDVKTTENAFNIAEKIRKRVKDNEIDVYAGNKLKKTISIGLAMFPEDGKNLDAVIKNADIALYEAKNKGRDSVVIFEESQVSSVDLF